MEKLTLADAQEFVLNNFGHRADLNLEDEAEVLQDNADIFLGHVDDAGTAGLSLIKFAAYPDLAISRLGDAREALLNAGVIIRDDATRRYHRAEAIVAAS